MVRVLLKLAVSSILLLAAACGDSGGFGLTTVTTGGSDGSSTTGVSGTTGGETTTTSGENTTTTAVESLLDYFPVDVAAGPVPRAVPLSDADVVVGGAPDARAADELEAAVAALGVDLTGMEIWVFPIADTGNWLMVLEFTDTGQQGEVDDTAGEQLFTTILGHPVIDRLPVTHLAMNYRGEDAEGGFVFTLTDTIANFRTALATDGDAETAQLQLVRVP
jgi:hypothetical protein